MSLVVDTDVVSFIFKNDTRASLYTPHLSGHILTISFQTLAELELWILAAGWGTRQRQQLSRYLRRYVVNYPLATTCQRWAEMIDAYRRQGRPVATADAWIAATALLLNVPLVTHNARDYSGVSGLTIITASNKPKT